MISLSYLFSFFIFFFFSSRRRHTRFDCDWSSDVCSSDLVWPNVYGLMAGLLPQAFLQPTTNSVVIGYRFAMTPNRLIGSVNSVARNIALLAYSPGPLAAGFLLGAVSARATLAVFGVCPRAPA